MKITDEELADELIARLNKLIEDNAVRHNLTQLLDSRIVCSGLLEDHPTIQTRADPEAGRYSIGFLGMLNGIVGAIPNGPGKGTGYIRCVCNDAGWIVRFERTP